MQWKNLGVHSFEPDDNEKKIGAFYREMFSNFVKTGVPDSRGKLVFILF